MNSGPKVAIILSVVLVFSMLAPPVVAQDQPDNLLDDNTFTPNNIPSEETFTTNNVGVWDQSIFTLRHDFENAPTAIKTGDFRASLGTGGDASLNRDFLGVRTAGDPVTLSYDPTRAQQTGADLSGNNVQVIAARVTGSGEPVTTFTEATDLISQENANSNATFDEIESDRSLNSGETTFTHTGDAGHYVYFVVDKSTGEFSVDNSGDIEIASGTPTVIGVEQITFQRGAPETVSAPAIAEPGEDLEFEIDTTNRFADDNVTHTVMVYDQSKFSDINEGRFTIQVSDRSDINENFNLSEDAKLFHEINEVNGVADVEDGIEVNGIDISDGRVSRAVSLGSVVDFVAEDIDGNATDTTATNNFGNVVLNASVTADAQRDRDHTVTVETADDWETGSYRYVYIGALENNASAVTTSTGTISIDEDVDVEDQASNSVDAGGASTVTLSSSDVSRVGFRGLKPGTTASVARISSPPRSVTARPDSVGTPRYLEINAETQSGSNATVEVTVNKSQFSNVNNAQVFRYNGSQFVGLPTSVVSETSSEVTLEFETGFSLFAIGERQSSTSPTTPGSPGSSSGGGGGGGGGGASATFTVSNLTPQDVEVTQGEEITVTARITTGSFLEDTQDVELRIDGDTVATQSVSLQREQNTTVEFAGINTTNLEGEFEHGVFTEDDSQTGTLTVTAPADDGADDDDAPADGTDQDDGADEDDDQPADGGAGTDGETDDGTPGFGPLVALIALVAAALLAARRER